MGVVKEIKDQEYRVGITPDGVRAFVKNGHEVLIEKEAGSGTGFSDEEYEQAGAKLIGSNKEVYSKAEMIYKIKEPLEPEYNLLRREQVVFTYFHFASDEKLTKAMLEREIVAIAYETIETKDGRLPLLEPMSEVAGQMASIVGAYYLAKPHGGTGILPGGVPGVPPAEFVILGGGTVGLNAARIAAGMGAHVTILQRSEARMRYLKDVLPLNVDVVKFSEANLQEYLKKADVVVSGVLVPGAKAPKFISRETLKTMKKGSVIVDVAVDQGGIAETTKPTFHSNPVYEVDGIIHYCVANMPGAYPRTSTLAITSVTLPYALEIANKGYRKALKENPALLKGLNMTLGKVTNMGVAEAFNLKYYPPETLI